MKKVEGFKMRSLGKERIILPEGGSDDLAAHDAASLAESWIEIGIVSE